ncbi:MAG: sulfatase-like hydrolase/transferase [Edaphobacter sp.]|uniref:sulfatase family protein n=1 Tax=Edaphobacter sp. TaxID=1934404 RepID=UPI00238E3FA5|nr:sulfatase-like hydrolase/transferase [Edaphobacter sp.]MDE1177936.1 sulfatase-like hydrolase/transferase [Edaphobacter sp.]
MASLALAAQGLPEAQAQEQKVERPNLIIVIADQRHYGLSKANGYPLDTSPTLDSLQQEGIAFKKNYCTTPLCVPSRISMLTGRWPQAHHVRMNLDASDAFFSQDLYQVAKASGYRTALTGKNHTYLTKDRVDVWREFGHDSGYMAPDAATQSGAFEQWLKGLHFNVAMEASPYPLETQLPYRITSEALRFIDETGDDPFLLQVSFPEPHDPEQVPAPYWNMFPPESIPPRCAGPEALQHMGPRAQWEYRLQQDNFPATEEQWRRYVSNYLGALRMIDDQIKRLVEHLEKKSLSKKTLVVFTSDHGDYLMDYGLGRKGVGLYEDLSHTPQIWWGYGVKPTPQVNSAFTSMADLMPTMCEAMGAGIPEGVQGRSLWPLLRGENFPQEEFQSIYAQVGLGGLYYDDQDAVPTSISHEPKRSGSWDELNKVTQSGLQGMVRMKEWKLIYDMMGYGQLYDLHHDPCELMNLFGKPQHAAQQSRLMAELAMWTIRLEDNLPTGPQNKKYQTKWPAKHNWYSPYRHGAAEPQPYIP